MLEVSASAPRSRTVQASGRVSVAQVDGRFQSKHNTEGIDARPASRHSASSARLCRSAAAAVVAALAASARDVAVLGGGDARSPAPCARATRYLFYLLTVGGPTYSGTVLLDCSKSSRQCSLPSFLTYKRQNR